MLPIRSLVQLLLLANWLHPVPVDCSFLQRLANYLAYDDNYITQELGYKYHFLRRDNASASGGGGGGGQATGRRAYTAPRDYFNFTNQLWPTREYLSRVNMEQYLYEELRSTEVMATKHFCSKDIWHYSDARELEASGRPEANATRCHQQLGLLQRELELARGNASRLFAPGERNIQLLRWIDSWGRPVSETYYGNSYWVGSYRGCNYAKVPPPPPPQADSTTNSQEEDISFRFCWGKLTARDWPQDDDMVPKTSLRVGLCLPRACDTQLANQPAAMATIQDLLGFNFSPMHRERFNKLLQIYCLPNNRHYSPAARAFLTLSCLWLALILWSSLYVAHCSSLSRRTQSGPFHARSVPRPIRYLSLQENFARFLAEDAPSPGSRVDLRPLGLLKLFGCVSICVGHLFADGGLYYYATTIMRLAHQDWFLELSGHFFKMVDLFAVLSAMLASYVILSKFPGDKIRQLLRPTVYLSLNAARYLRLAPALIVAAAFMKSTFVHLSEGPFWDYGTSREHSQLGLCRHKIGWFRLTLWPIVFDFDSSAGSHYQLECLPLSWYIITEMKAFLVVPLYIYLIYRHRRLRIPLTLGAVLVSTLWHYKELRMQPMIYVDQFYKYGRFVTDLMLSRFVESSYFSVLGRFHATAIGLLAGLQLYRYKLAEIRGWPKWMRGYYLAPLFAWLAYDLAAQSLEKLSYQRTGYIPSEEWIRWTMVLKPRVDALVFAILALRMCSDWAPAIMRQAMLFYKLSKLSYCVYLLHTILIAFFLSATEKSRPDAQPLQLFIVFVFIVTTSLLFSLPAFILIESPLALLLSHWMESNKLAKSTLLMQKHRSKANKKMH